MLEHDNSEMTRVGSHVLLLTINRKPELNTLTDPHSHAASPSGLSRILKQGGWGCDELSMSVYVTAMASIYRIYYRIHLLEMNTFLSTDVNKDLYNLFTSRLKIFPY